MQTTPLETVLAPVLNLPDISDEAARTQAYRNGYELFMAENEIRDQLGVGWTDSEFSFLMGMFISADPWPLRPDQHQTVTDILTAESHRREYPDWITAYHNFRAA